jgi:hypothetical protein
MYVGSQSASVQQNVSGWPPGHVALQALGFETQHPVALQSCPPQ